MNQYVSLIPVLDGSLDGDLDLVKLCIKNGGDANQPNEEGLTPLHSAACNGHAKIVNFLLENGANVNVVDDDLWTPLHGAACFGEVAVVRDLVQHGANVAAANAENDLPMDIAVEEKTKKYLTEVNDNRKKATQLYALYDFEAEEDDELSFSAGAILTIITPEADRDTTWWTAQSVNKAKGFIPANFVGVHYYCKWGILLLIFSNRSCTRQQRASTEAPYFYFCLSLTFQSCLTHKKKKTVFLAFSYMILPFLSNPIHYLQSDVVFSPF